MKREIKVVLLSKEMYENPYDNLKLNASLSDYIYEQCRGEALKKNLEIVIEHQFKMSNQQKDCLVTMIRRNYGIMAKEHIILFKYSIFWKFLLFLFGIGLLIITYYINLLNHYIISEFLTIIFYVAIWGAVESFFFENGKKILEIKRYKKLTQCKIIFKDCNFIADKDKK